MASLLGASSTAILASRRLSSISESCKKCYGGIGFQTKKGRCPWHLAVTNVATDINSVEQAQRLVSKKSQRPVYPFAAIVGQDEMKLCILLNIIDSKIGGVMIMGDRGTGKSTTVRSLVDLLPEISVKLQGSMDFQQSDYGKF